MTIKVLDEEESVIFDPNFVDLDHFNTYNLAIEFVENVRHYNEDMYNKVIRILKDGADNNKEETIGKILVAVEENENLENQFIDLLGGYFYNILKN